MLAFELEQPPLAAKPARMEQRTNTVAKELIERAARALGVNASEFTVTAACRAARETLGQYQVTALKPEAQQAFLDAFEREKPEPALVDLMRLHAEVSTTR